MKLVLVKPEAGFFCRIRKRIWDGREHSKLVRRRVFRICTERTRVWRADERHRRRRSKRHSRHRTVHRSASSWREAPSRWRRTRTQRVAATTFFIEGKFHLVHFFYRRRFVVSFVFPYSNPKLKFILAPGARTTRLSRGGKDTEKSSENFRFDEGMTPQWDSCEH